jgi:hypothetical protein
MIKYLLPAVLMTYGLIHLLSLKIKFPERIEYFFRINRIPALFIFLPENIRKHAGAIITGLAAFGVGIWIAIII